MLLCLQEPLAFGFMSVCFDKRRSGEAAKARCEIASVSTAWALWGWVSRASAVTRQCRNGAI